MKVSGLYASFIYKFLFLFVLFLLGSCSSSDDGDSGSTAVNDPTTNAVLNVSSKVADIISNTADGVSGAGGDSEALSSVLAFAGITLAPNGNQGLSDSLINLIKALMNPKNAVVTQVGDDITIVPSASRVCNNLATQLGFAVGSVEYDNCLQILAGIEVEITMATSDSGDLELRHNGNPILKLQYSPTQLVTTIDLADLLAALNSMIATVDPSSIVPPPTTLAGEIALALNKLGNDHGSIQLDITQAIDIQDATAGISFAQGVSTLFFAEADGVAGEATVSSTLGAISAMLPIVVDDFTGEQQPASFTMASGTELTLSVTDSGAGASGTVRVGTTNLDINSLDELDFFLDPDFTVDPGTGVITMTTALDMDLGYTDTTYGLFGYNGTLNIDAPAGTSVLEISGTSPFDAVYEVQTGSVTFAGTGDFASYSDTVSVGECFNIDGPTSCVVMSGCNFDVTGTWLWEVTNIDSPLCGPEPGWDETVTVTQTNCSLIVTNFTDAIGQITGNIVGDTVTVGPFAKQDGSGVTTATFTMTVVPNGLEMNGNESWTWAGNTGGSCGLGTADITATRQ